MKWVSEKDALVLVEPKAADEITISKMENIPLKKSKEAVIQSTKLLAESWPLEQILLTRAGHLLMFLAPYAREVANIQTPQFVNQVGWLVGGQLCMNEK